MTTPTNGASPIPGIKALSMGSTGSGKTTAIKTWIDAGITPMCIFTENSFDVLGDVPKEKLHWMYIKPTTSDLQNLIKSAKIISMQNADMIQKGHDMSRAQYNQYMPFLDALAGYKCQRTGQKFGNVGEWGTDKVLVTDSLSGITLMATKLAVGEKYAMTQPEFQIAMKVIENLIIQICNGFHCHAYMTSHLEREVDEVEGGSKLFPSTLGRKLAPVLGRYFTDVFIAKRDGNAFVWDTADKRAELKGRNMPIAANNPASFVPLVKAWQKRGGIISPELPVTPEYTEEKE